MSDVLKHDEPRSVKIQELLGILQGAVKKLERFDSVERLDCDIAGSNQGAVEHELLDDQDKSAYRSLETLLDELPNDLELLANRVEKAITTLREQVEVIRSKLF